MFFFLSPRSLSCFSCRRTFLSTGADRDNAPIAGDDTSTSMSVLAQDEELLVERNDIARLSLPVILLIFFPARVRNFKSTKPDFSIWVYSSSVSVGPGDGDLDTCFSCHSRLEHCSYLVLKAKRSSFPLIWNLISPAPTSM